GAEIRAGSDCARAPIRRSASGPMGPRAHCSTERHAETFRVLSPNSKSRRRDGLDSSSRHRLPLPARRCAAAATALILTSRALVPIACPLLLGACALPSLQDRPSTFALRDTVDTRLASATASEIAEHPGRSGIYPLP